ncbi:MAG TPA: peptidase M48, partial [Gammaproteobacteria bacterium]|nr:peptidase M48 [Gammaproteobacteria bacterium]
GLFASHPPSQERVENNRLHAATLPKGGVRGVARYQQVMQRLQSTKTAYQAYEDATAAFAEADFAAATSLAQKAVSIEPNEAQFHSLLGDIASINDRLARAQKHYRHAIGLNEAFFYPHLQRGLVSRELGQVGVAKSSLNRSIELLPTATAYNALGEIAESEGNLNQAEKYFAAASKDSGEAGQSALTALVKLRIAERPGAYIDTQIGLASNGEWIVIISNTAPRDFTSVVLELAYADSNNRMRRQQIRVGGTLAAQGRRRVNSGLSAGVSLDPPRITVRRVQLATN